MSISQFFARSLIGWRKSKFDDDIDLTDEDWEEDEGLPWGKIVAAGGVSMLVLLLLAKKDDFVRAWRRRQAAKAARALGRDEEMAPVESWLIGTTRPVKVMIEVDSDTHTIGADAASFSSVSQLPFALTDACVESGYPELSGLSVVDLTLAKRATLSYEGKDGVVRAVDGQTTAWDLQTAKSVRVIVQKQ